MLAHPVATDPTPVTLFSARPRSAQADSATTGAEIDTDVGCVAFTAAQPACSSVMYADAPAPEREDANAAVTASTEDASVATENATTTPPDACSSWRRPDVVLGVTDVTARRVSR